MLFTESLRRFHLLVGRSIFNKFLRFPWRRHLLCVLGSRCHQRQATKDRSADDTRRTASGYSHGFLPSVQLCHFPCRAKLTAAVQRDNGCNFSRSIFCSRSTGSSIASILKLLR